MSTSPGCLYVEAAPFLEKIENVNKYDWLNSKISLQLKVTHISNLITNLKKKISFQLDLTNKTIAFDSQLNIFTITSDLLVVKCKLLAHEVDTLIILLEAIIVKAYGWN